MRINRVFARMAAVAVPMIVLTACEQVDKFVQDPLAFLRDDVEVSDYEPAPIDTARVEQEDVADGYVEHKCRGIQRVTVQQQEDVWCWAACAEMIYRHEGRSDLTQSDFAERIHAYSESLPEGTRDERIRSASHVEIIRALTVDTSVWNEKADELLEAVRYHKLDLQTVAAKDVVVMGTDHVQQLNVNFLVESIYAGRPLVAGLGDRLTGVGHAYLIYGVAAKPAVTSHIARFRVPSMTHAEDVEAAVEYVPRYKLKTLLMIDPWDGTQIRMTPADFARDVSFLMNRPKAEAIVQDVAGAIRSQ